MAPAEGPMAAPSAADAPQIPITRERRSAGKSGRTIAREAGLSIEPPMPCTTRAAINSPGLGAAPDRNDPATKIVTPIMKSFRRPF